MFYQVLIWRVDDVKTLRFILNQSLKQWLTGRKKGPMEIQKFEYLENEKSFLDEIKTSLIVFEMLSFGEKQKFVKK